MARADGRMGSFGLAMTPLPGGDFLLLATERSLLPFTLASAEEIQDHNLPGSEVKSPRVISGLS